MCLNRILLAAFLCCSLLFACPKVSQAAPPLSLKGVVGLPTPDAFVALEVWRHPSGDRLVALTDEAVYAIDPAEQTFSKWLDGGGRALASEGEQVYRCSENGVSRLDVAGAELVWKGDCRAIVLAASIWVQSGDSLVRLGWTAFQEQERVRLEVGEQWAIVADQLVRWRRDPPQIRTRTEHGDLRATLSQPPRKLVSNSVDARWLLDDGRTIIGASLQSRTLASEVDALVRLPDYPDWSLGVLLDNRALRLIDEQGDGDVLLPTLARPEEVALADLDKDGCVDLVVWGDEAAWVKLRCMVPQSAGPTVPSQSKNVASANGSDDSVLISSEWVAKTYEVAKPMRLELRANGTIAIDPAVIPPGVRFTDGRLEGTPTTAGLYPITATVKAADGAISAGGLSLEIVGADGVLPAPPPPVVREPRTQCLLSTGVLVGTGSAQVDWTNLTGQRTVFGSPTFSLLCSDRRGPKFRLLYGGETAPTAVISDDEVKALLVTGVVHYGATDEGIGLYASGGALSLSAGLRVVKQIGSPSQQGRMRGIELRVGWLPATVGAVEFSAAYTWKMGRRYRKKR